MNADLILYNTRAITFDPVMASAAFVAIKENRILYAGNSDELDSFRGPQTRLLDCEEGTTIPGFNDAHCHPLSLAAILRYVDCSPGQVQKIADIQLLLGRQAQEKGSGTWIRAAGYDVSSLLDNRHPNRWDLDKSTPDNPVILVECSGQYCVLNSLALQRCGIPDIPSNESSGTIHVDPETGRTNGIISGNNEAVARAIPPLTDREMETAVTEANRIFLSQGITSLQDTSWTNTINHWLRIKDYKEKNLLSPRINFMPGFDAIKDFRGSGLSSGHGNSQIRIGAVKIALDESTDNHEPPVDAICNAAMECHQAGFQLAFHVSDLYLLRASLHALSSIHAANPLPDSRPRFEHCPVCTPELLSEIAAHHALVISQPGLLYETGPDYLDTADEEQLSWVFPYHSMQRREITVSFSSDSPRAGSDPLKNIQTAITRITRDGRCLSSRERIALHDAVKMYTLAGAFSSFEEDIKGSIRPGKLADLVVLDRDISQTAPEQISEASVRATLIDGNIVWEC